MIGPLNPWFTLALDATRMGLEAQQVIGLRLMRLAAGGPAAGPEAGRMVLEKVAALAEAQGILAASLLEGRGHKGMSDALDCFSRRVRANGKRLQKGRRPRKR